jgi:hypothetical protein
MQKITSEKSNYRALNSPIHTSSGSAGKTSPSVPIFSEQVKQEEHDAPLQMISNTNPVRSRFTQPNKEKNETAIQLKPAQTERFRPVQLQDSGLSKKDVNPVKPFQLKAEQTKPNNTGLPDQLKTGIEKISGFSMDDVKVHYHSDKPAQLQALAYAQGSNIHLGPGQEKHLPHEAWHVVQQKQGRVQPTMQMKTGEHVNDDHTLEQEADAVGQSIIDNSVSTQLKAELGIEASDLNRSVTNNIIQRKVLIQGGPLNAHLQPDEDINQEVLLTKGHWINDQYKRNYESLDEFYAHALGEPVQCGLIPALALWYRLPLPSQYNSLPVSFFLLGEVHNIFPLRLLVEESNQQSAKVLAESGASFTNIPYTAPGGANPDLPASANKPNTRLAELGLAKALFAFAAQYDPAAGNNARLRMDGSSEIHEIVPSATPLVTPTVWIDAANVTDWENAARALPKYRNKEGRPYYITTDHAGIVTGHLRTNISSANGYGFHAATGNFLANPEIKTGLGDPGIVVDYERIIGLGRNGFPDYAATYNRVFSALRAASIANITAVYPGQNAITRPNPKKKPGLAGGLVRTDIEVAMNHRNTAMVGALEQANTGGYALASFGAQHVIDIAAWYAAHGGAPFSIITYSDFVHQTYSL